MSLFIRECKQISKSIIYFAFVGACILFYFTQLGNFAGEDISQAESNSSYSASNTLMKPPFDAKSYGTRQAEIPEQIMPKAILGLVSEYSENKYTTYPFGFYKTVKLNADEQLRITDIIEEITGSTSEALEEIFTEHNRKLADAYLKGTTIPQADVNIPIAVSYEIFGERMSEVDKILGGGSSYSRNRLLDLGQMPITYEEKLAEYEAFICEDKVTGAHARLFCDYMGIVIGLFGIFVPVSFLMRDKKAHIQEIIYSRKKGSVFIVLSRYFAVTFMSLLPILILSLIPTVQLVSYGLRADITVDVFAFIKYISAWLLPTLLTTTAVGFFFTILTDTPIAIAVQLIWSFVFDLMKSVPRLGGGNYGFELFIRHNTLGNLQAMKDGMNALVINRSVYTLLAFALVLVTAFIYEQKRRGKIDVGSSLQKIFRRDKSTN